MPRLIDADAVLDTIRDYFVELAEEREKEYGADEIPMGVINPYLEMNKMLRTKVKQIPTVDAVPTEFHDKCMEIEIEKRFELELKEKHGHWSKSYISAWYSSDDNDHLYLYCSVCGERIELQGVPAEKMEEEGKLFKYCPWCGAKMDEVEDE